MTTRENPEGAHKSHIRVLIADDCEMMRLLLKLLVDDFPDLYLVGSAQNGEDAVSLCRELRPDVVLMDVSMPVMNGLVATQLIREQCPHTQVIILSMSSDEELAQVARGAGAFRLILKSSVDTELIQMIRAAAEYVPAPARRGERRTAKTYALA